MSERDDFLSPVRHVLAKRVNNHCSFPGCFALTSGPDENPDKAISIGVAAHITAAAKGGPRFDEALTEDERSSAFNGIWMCQTHSREIDVDRTLTAQTLRAWKDATEQRVRGSLGIPERGMPKLLSRDILRVSRPGILNAEIGDLLQRCGLESVWGRSEHGATQDLILEVARNAVEHGGATSITVMVEPHRVTLLDNGARFDPTRDLRGSSISGGQQAWRTISTFHGQDLIIVSQRHNDTNELTITRIEALALAGALPPCTLQLSIEDVRAADDDPSVLKLERYDGCAEIVVILPSYLSPSDALLVAQLLDERFPPESRQGLVLVAQNTSDHTMRWLAMFMPLAQFRRVK